MIAKNIFWMIYVKEDRYGDGPYWWSEIFRTRQEAIDYRRESGITYFVKPAKTYIRKVEINYAG